MSDEHRQYPPPELLNEPEVRIRFAPSVTVSELLGKRLQDAKGLSLTQTPINMFKAQRKNYSLATEFFDYAEKHIERYAS